MVKREHVAQMIASEIVRRFISDTNYICNIFKRFVQQTLNYIIPRVVICANLYAWYAPALWRMVELPASSFAQNYFNLIVSDIERSDNFLFQYPVLLHRTLFGFAGVSSSSGSRFLVGAVETPAYSPR